MTKGRRICNVLKDVRREIAAKNDIPLDVHECTHKGECAGTCPRCEAEVKALERALERRRKAGKTVVVAGISAGLMVTAACSPIEQLEPLDGDMRVLETTEVIETATAGDITEVPGTVDAVVIEGGLIPETPELEGEIAVETLAGDIALPEGAE
ncbi:MAG: hypothetical protein IJ493_13460 [Clostridia bacterium]|nr:hypothetical protein [Clostridia bacterium]